MVADAKQQSTDTSSNTLDEIACEIERLERDFRAMWHRFVFGKKLAFLSALGIFFGVFMPWLSVTGIPTEIGLTHGGAIHVCLSTIALAITPRSVDQAFDPFILRRRALLDIIIGTLCTFACIILLFHFGQIKGETHLTVDIRYGFYFCLVCGIGISLGGFLQFEKDDNLLSS